MQQELQSAGQMDESLASALPPDKPALRRHMRNVRAAMMDAERATASAAICARLLNLNLVESRLHKSGAPMAIYLATPAEVNLDSFIEALLKQGVAIAAPHDVGAEEVSFYSLRDLHSTLRRGKFGLRTPLEYSGGKVYAPRQLGIVLLPGLAFDRDGGRLGQGGGWYDRVVPQAQLSIGICFDCQLIDAVPQEPHDARVDVVLTETQLIDVRGRLSHHNGQSHI